MLFLLAAEAVPDLDVTAYIDNPPIALLIILLMGAIAVLASGRVLVPRFFYDREKERADANGSRVEKLTDVLAEYNDELHDLQRRGKAND
jgi:hypothetical protein